MIQHRKLIGARFYNNDDDDDSKSTSLTDEGTPRDSLGHGTHTSSTAAGSLIEDASYYGLAPGTAKGGSPGSRIAMYKVCGSFGCTGSALLAAFDDAISDGVDVLSISIGASAFAKPDFSVDPIAIGSFHAVAKGITVVCSAGNDGPGDQTVVNAAPWILTVAATTIDRTFESDIVLGGNHMAVKGEGINFSNLSKTADYPLIGGGSVKSNSSTEEEASHCELGELDPSKIKGKIIFCKQSTDDSSKSSKADFMKRDGAIGAIFAVETETSNFRSFIDFPVTIISSKEAGSLSAYINSSVASFSSRGPCSQTGNILKPDIAAPGVNILASWIPTNDSSDVPAGHKPSTFSLDSGTSMACPHVAGVAATVKSWNPSWSPSAIRSAIMTTGKHLQVNVGAVEETSYIVSVKTPDGLDVKVNPEKLQFTKNVKSLSYQVTFSVSSSSVKGSLFGSITWSDGVHRVRSPFAVELVN